MAKARPSSAVNVIIVIAILVALYVLWKRVFSPSARYDDAAVVEKPRKPVLATVPNGTPLRLADAMRMSVDETFPRIQPESVKVLHGDGEAKTLVADVMARLAKNGATKVTPLALETAKISKFVDAKGVTQTNVEFLVHDATATKPGYPAEQVSKLAATYLQAQSSKPALYSLVFATPRAPIEGAPMGYDADDVPLAKFASPLEQLRQMNFNGEVQS